MCGTVPPAAGVCLCVYCSFGGMVKGCGLPQCLGVGQKRCVSVCFVDIWHTVCFSVIVCV